MDAIRVAVAVADRVAGAGDTDVGILFFDFEVAEADAAR